MGFYDKQSNDSERTKGLAQDEVQPPYDDESRQPKTMTTTMRRDGVLYVAGKPPIDNLPTEIMFVATSVQEEEASEGHTSHYGMKFKQEAEYLRGPIGDMFKDVCGRAGIDIRKCYYTSVVKWLLPRAMRSKPATKVLKWGMPVLLDEIKKAKPKIIVCLGKPAFDQLSDTKIGFDDATGGWFWSTKANAHLYVMRSPTELLMKPELFEGFRVDLVEVKRKLDLINEVAGIEDLPVRTQVIRSAEHLRDWVAQMQEEGHKLFSVDGEWHGNTHIDGNLRSLQLAWTDSDAIYIRFRDENNEWDFELDTATKRVLTSATVDPTRSVADHPLRGDELAWVEYPMTKSDLYAEVGKILQPLLNQPDVKYVGHHYVADALWMAHWLGLEVLGKCYLDTEFAQQTVDEASELKLERGISMKYTTLGRYDIDLILWKKKNKKLCEGGYGYIPDDILIPYACRDVLAVYRAVPMIRKQMHFQKLEDYYDKIFGPFVTDVFYTFAEVGLPMDVPLMDEMRELFNFAKRELDREFKVKVYTDAKQRLMAKLVEVLGALKIAQAMAITKDVVALVADGRHEEAWTCLKAEIPLDQVIAFRSLLDHLIVSPDFNIRSAPDMRRWLFDVSGMTPIKSTNQKSKGMPSMDWSKVLELPKERQSLYTPACDKQTLQILAEKLPLVDELLDLNVVGNLCKAFLKEAETYWDDDLGEEVEEEAGLHKWLASNGRIHGQTSTTETGRPRGWRPNSLNFPSYVNKRIGKAMARVIAASVEARKIDMPNEERIKRGMPLPLPDSLMKWSHVKTERDIPSIRSLIKAPSGWCLTESDYKTAEIRGLAFISGDENLIRLMTEEDPEWAFTKTGDKVRVAYADFADSGIPKEKQDPKYFLGTWEDGKLIKQFTEDDLLRDEQTGKVIHCSYDLHWSLAEWTYEKPREEMKDKVARAAAKVGNFCIAEGQPVLTRRGWVPIEQVMDCDLLWDGVEWVRHAGLRYKGVRAVYSYGGIEATGNHEVWTEEEGKVFFERAIAQRLTLVRPPEPSARSARAWAADLLGNCKKIWKRVFPRPDGVHGVRREAREGTPQHGEGPVVEVPVPGSGQVSEPSGQESGAALRGYAAALRAGLARIVAQLQVAGDYGRVRLAQGLRPLGIGYLPGTGLQGHGLRSYRQRWAVLEGESAPSGQDDQPAQSPWYSLRNHSSRSGFSVSSPGGDLHRAHRARAFEEWYEQRRAAGASPGQCSRDGEAEISKARLTRVYDIYDAGPRNRFVCGGVLVSNSSAYGASPASLERKIEADTGVKPEEGTGQKLLDAIRARQPRATEFLEQMQEVPKQQGWYRAKSGRIRHCVMHARDSGVGYRTRNSIESAVGREMRNFPMQESVASTAARAGIELNKIYRQLGMKARVMTILYDSVVTLCPLEERFVCARLHEVYMHEENHWSYTDEFGTRKFAYPIDNEFNYRWSTKPSKDEQKELGDPEWHPTPDRLKFVENMRFSFA